MNNELEAMNNEVTMTLKDITDILDVRHNNAMRVVDKLNGTEGFGTTTEIEQSFISGNGATKTTTTYLLNKTQSMIVSAKLNDKLLVKIVLRWEELEALQNKTPKLPQNYHEALVALADEVGKTMELEAKIKKDAPMAELGKKFVEAKAYLTLNETAKQLGQAPQAFNMFLREEGMLMKCKSNGALLPMQNSINKGWMKVHTDHRYHPRTGEKINTSSTRVTSKGLVAISKRLGKRNIDVYGMLDQ